MEAFLYVVQQILFTFPKKRYDILNACTVGEYNAAVKNGNLEWYHYTNGASV